MKDIHLIYNPYTKVYTFGEGRDKYHLKNTTISGGDSIPQLLKMLGEKVDSKRKLVLHYDGIPEKVLKEIQPLFRGTKVTLEEAVQEAETSKAN